MIAFLNGKIMNYQSENKIIILLENGIGYEVMLPTFIKKEILKLNCVVIGMYIYQYSNEYHSTPTLIGFNTIEEKEIFKILISADSVGPSKIAKAAIIPFKKIASIIVNGDVISLSKLPGLGKVSAQEMINSLSTKLEKYVEKKEFIIEINKMVKKLTK